MLGIADTFNQLTLSFKQTYDLAQGNLSRVEELHKHISEMEHLIEQLQTECPVEFGPQKKQVEDSTESMKKKYEDAMAAVFQF